MTAMLEKNRDNLAKALPGLAKFELTQGETVSSGFYYNAFVPNLSTGAVLAAVLRLRVRLPRAVQRRPAAGQRRAAGRAPVPVQRDSAAQGQR